MPAVVLVLAAVASWFGRGVIAVTSSRPDALRVGLLPPLWHLAVLIAAAVVAAAVLRPSWSRTLPLLFVCVLLLPWTPASVPAAAFVWTGRVALAVWLIVALSIVLSTNVAARVVWTGALSPRRAPLVAGLLALVLYAAAFWRVMPRLVGGDEPHYLIITQSLLNDGDLRIENNHRRAEYREYFAGDLKPDFLRRGKDAEIYSIHAPGLPALIAPAFALAGYPGVVVLLMLLASAGTALAWKLAYEITGDAGAAWYGWAAVALSTPYVFHAFSIYPDGAAAPLVLTGFWAALEARGDTASRAVSLRRWFLYGTALAVLPWMHSRLAMLSGTLGLFVLLGMWRRRRAFREASAFLAVPMVSGGAWFWFFQAVYGEPSPFAPYRGSAAGSVAYITSGIGGLLFDQQFGLVANAPAYLIAGAGLVALCRRRSSLGDAVASQSRARVAAQLAILSGAYLLSVTPMRMWWAGWSAPARFAVPILLPFAIPAAELWKTARSQSTRAIAAAALAATALLSVMFVWVDRGRLAYNVRDGYALWLDWLNPLADLSHGLPSFHRGAEASSFFHVAVWGACLVGGWIALRALERSGGLSRSALAPVTLFCLSLAATVALTLVWLSNGVTGLTPVAAQLELLRHAEPDRRGVAFTYPPLRRIAIDRLPATLRIDPSERYLAGRDRPLFALPAIPAGSYLVHVRFARPVGTISVGIGREPHAIHSVPLNDLLEQDGTLRLDFPVDVRSITIRGDDAARESVETISLEPILLSRSRSAGYAREARRYAGGTVYFLDEGAFAEPDAFWVKGRRAAETVMVPRTPGATIGLFLRNAPVENRLTVGSGKWQREFLLTPREERSIEIPLERTAGAATRVRFETTSGFIPALVDRASADFRLLGVWVELR